MDNFIFWKQIPNYPRIFAHFLIWDTSWRKRFSCFKENKCIGKANFVCKINIILYYHSFNLCNTFLLGYYFSNFAANENSWLTDIRFIIGVTIFILGVWINWKADNILIHLRKPEETDYKIPKGCLFKYISCPNMLGELIEWAGFAILCWNLPALTFFIWSAANLVPRALAHHKWYKNKFADYPKDRKAIIPFIS